MCWVFPAQDCPRVTSLVSLLLLKTRAHITMSVRVTWPELLANSDFLHRFCSSAAQFGVSQEVLEFSQASKRTSQPCDAALRATRRIQQPPCCIVAARPLQRLLDESVELLERGSRRLAELLWLITVDDESLCARRALQGVQCPETLFLLLP